jgi:hypothetical protein
MHPVAVWTDIGGRRGRRGRKQERESKRERGGGSTFFISKKSFQIINQTRQNNEFRFSGVTFAKPAKKAVK